MYVKRKGHVLLSSEYVNRWFENSKGPILVLYCCTVGPVFCNCEVDQPQILNIREVGGSRSYIVADMYCVFRPVMVASIPKRLFLVIVPKQYNVTTICITHF